MRSPWSPCKCMYLSKEQFSMQLMLRAWHSGLELHGGHRCPFNHCRALLMTSNMHYVQKPFPITSWIGMIIELFFFFLPNVCQLSIDISTHKKYWGKKIPIKQQIVAWETDLTGTNMQVIKVCTYFFVLSGFEFLIANWNLPLYLGLLLCFWITMDIIMSYLLSWPTIVFSLVMLIARRLNAYYTLCVLCPQILKPADKKKFTYGLNSGRPLTPPRGPAKNKGKK